MVGDSRVLAEKNTDGPHMLQIMHNRLPPPFFLYSIHAIHPAHFPLIPLYIMVVVWDMVISNSITLVKILSQFISVFRLQQSLL